jgi:hypothetical protein
MGYALVTNMPHFHLGFDDPLGGVFGTEKSVVVDA